MDAVAIPRRRFRLRRRLKWCGTALCILLLAASAASFAWHFDVFLGASHFGFLCGSAHVIQNKSAPSGFWPLSCAGQRVAPIEWKAIAWLPRRITTPQAQIEIFPLWIPLALIAIPTAYLWRRDWRFVLPGCCRTCKYDLTGNTTGVCPECGQPAERAE